MREKTPNSYSSLSTLAKCERRYFYAYESKLESRDPAIPLRLGGAIHIGLYWLHNGGTLDQAIEGALKEWGGFKVPPAAKHHFVNDGFIERVIRNYAKDNDEWMHRTQGLEFGGYAAEELVEVEVEPGLVIAGKIDLPTKIGDNYVLIDHKTTGDWLSSWWAEQFEFSHQLRLYIIMLRKLTGLPFDRAYINGVYVGAGAADPDDAWKKRKSGRSGLYGPFIFSPSHLEETLRWVRSKQRRYIQLKEESEGDEEGWTQNDTGRGCQGCEFRGVCKSSPAIRAGIIARDFTVGDVRS